MSKTYKSSVLSVYDDTGKKIEIPAIKGKDGDSGVYVGTGTPPQVKMCR